MTGKARMVQVHTVPWLLGWAIKVNGRRVARFSRQSDAEACAIFLARLMPAATVKFHGRRGRIKRESTFPRAADPRRTKS